jgi:hypothetical protein
VLLCVEFQFAASSLRVKSPLLDHTGLDNDRSPAVYLFDSNSCYLHMTRFFNFPPVCPSVSSRFLDAFLSSVIRSVSLAEFIVLELIRLESISQDEIDMIKAVFLAVDRDKSGTIEYEEVMSEML